MITGNRSYSVVGGGLVGLSTALHLARWDRDAAVRVFEKESEVGAHQSTHNSGVLHAGLYYKPGSLKARLAVTGLRQMVAYCREFGVAHEICGKVVVALDDTELGQLKTLFERGTQNGLLGLRWLNGIQLREIEPNVSGVAAIHVPEEGIVDYSGVCRAMESELRQLGGDVVTSARVLDLRQEQDGWHIATSAGDWHSSFLVNCAGLQCDRVAKLAGINDTIRIVPFRGEYFKLHHRASHLVRNLIYPVPDASFPFLGVHFTRLIHGGIEAGPNAVLALSREGYERGQFNLSDLKDSLGYPGLWRFIARHGKMVWGETRRSYSRKLFCQALQRLVPDLKVTDLLPGGVGIRAQAMALDGTLLQDFHFVDAPNALHVLNAPSPGATACLAIGNHIVNRIKQRITGVVI